MYTRQLDLVDLVKHRSAFLLGPRMTGKSTLARTQLPNAHVFDLLDAETFSRLAREPRLLGQEAAAESTIVIDEVQRLPGLLNEVHRLIEREQRRFLLTGSSARKLRRGAVNLLGGRAWEASLLPLTWAEIPNFDLLRYLNRGGLPAIYDSDVYARDLRSYVSLYLREEVAAEALTRNLPAFARFMDAIGLCNGEELNHHSLASDVGIPVSTLNNYLEILSDTLIGFSLPGFTKTKKRKSIARAKYFLFDVGVTGALAERGEIRARSELFGRAFEHFIVQEVRAYNLYRDRNATLAYWRSTSQFEVDLVVGTKLAIEVKATNLVVDKHLSGLRALGEENIFSDRIVVSQDPRPRLIEPSLRVLPWQVFLKELWDGALF